MTEKKRVGRPSRKTVKTTQNIDADLYESIQCIAEHNGLPMARVINMIIRAMFESNTNIKLI